MATINITELRKKILSEVETVVEEKIHEVMSNWAKELAQDMSYSIIDSMHDGAGEQIDRWITKINTENKTSKNVIQKINK